VSVIIFHLQNSLPNALQVIGNIGWMGVDLFFVLSGFLIGSQLLRPFAAGRQLDVTGFYLRRAYRILPAYLAVLLLYFAVPEWRERPGLAAPWKFVTFT
jgi:peptidoglycan/LPS O-acetylase OafA/YrhL